MKTFLLGILMLLVVMGVVSQLLVPEPPGDGKVQLAWTTDPNPQRDPQVEWFNKLYPDCNLRIDPDNSDSMKVIVQSCAGMGPDIIGQVGWWSIQNYHEAGILMDLTEHADRMGFGLDTLAESVRPLTTLKVLNDQGRIEDRMFAYPCNVFHTYIIYNKNIFDQRGVPYPPEDLTWTQYMELARQLTVRDEARGLPIVFGAAGVKVDAIIFQRGAEYLNEEGTRCTMDSPAFIDAMVFYHRLFYELDIEPTPLQKAGVSSQGGWGGGYNNWFGEGKIGMYWGSRWMLISFRRFISEQNKVREAWIEAHPDGDPADAPAVLRMGACQIPRFKDGVRYTATGARCAAINVASPHREKALNFLQYLAGEKYSGLINEGADSKPGNIAYNAVDQFLNPEWPGEDEVHRASLRAIPFGRARRRSMLVNIASVNAEFSQVKSRLEATPDMTRAMIATELERAADRVNLVIARNIKRNPGVRAIYDALLANGAEPVVYDLGEVR
jgi:ABC-type glycerol-3-phosphate transport system substrate-binding protein